jgi:hypothetical protein
MIEAETGLRNRWAIAAAVGVLVLATVVLVLRPPPVVLPMSSPPLSGVELRQVTAEETAFSEETKLRDLTPLFLPTERNATLRQLPSREPGHNFLEIEAPKFVIADSGWRFDRGLPATVMLNARPLSQATPLDYLDEAAAEAPFMSMGRDKLQIPALSPRGGVMEVVRTRDGLLLFSEEIRAEHKPPTDKTWQPVEFLASVGPAGLVTPLNVSVRSGVEEVDLYFRNHLANVYRIGERLLPGIYRISVAP